MAMTGLFPEELAGLLKGLPSFRSKQIFRWIARGVPSFDGMTDIPGDLREALAAQYPLYGSGVARKLEDPDGTVKLQISLADGAMIEAALLRDDRGRQTACISTQAGCPMGCLFCKTGSLGFLRNLEAHEIVEQLLHLRRVNPGIANVVVMGMGEPLLNLGELRRAVGIITHPGGLGLSKRRITLSTSGIIPGIRDLTDSGPDLRLALSLTTADQALREELMPGARSNPLPALKEELLRHQEKLGRRITLEAALLGGVNTRDEDMDSIAAFARGLSVVVNLIPWNPVEGMSFRGRPLREPGAAEVERFHRGLAGRGLAVTRRYRKGRAISAACGQLGELPLPLAQLESRLSQAPGKPCDPLEMA